MGEVREILFRGKRADDGKWVEGYVYRLSEKLNPFIMIKDRCGESYEVITETVCEYTGLIDKNGIEIFVGDILQYRCDIGRVTDNAWGTDTVYGYAIDNPNLDLSDHSNMEVIGNIHDNPELLKEDK